MLSFYCCCCCFILFRFFVTTLYSLLTLSLLLTEIRSSFHACSVLWAHQWDRELNRSTGGEPTNPVPGHHERLPKQTAVHTWTWMKDEQEDSTYEREKHDGTFREPQVGQSHGGEEKKGSWVADLSWRGIRVWTAKDFINLYRSLKFTTEMIEEALEGFKLRRDYLSKDMFSERSPWPQCGCCTG